MGISYFYTSWGKVEQALSFESVKFCIPELETPQPILPNRRSRKYCTLGALQSTFLVVKPVAQSTATMQRTNIF